MIVLANDGISPAGKKALTEFGYEVRDNHVKQAELAAYINAENIGILLVRSATQVRKDLIDACPGLKLIGRGGVGMDNIDVAYAREKGIKVVNTPASSSQSVAELVMGQLFSLVRMTYDANRNMPEKGATEFAALKKKYSKGTELRGKTLGIIGFGRIGRSLASYALGCGMRVICADHGSTDTTVKMSIAGMADFEVDVPEVGLDKVLEQSDFISLHVPKQKDGAAVLGAAEFTKMKKGVYLLNAARGGVINEDDLLAALENGTVAACALDVFENEPTPRPDLLKHPRIASTPHIGAATEEAQDRIGEELADLIAETFGKHAQPA